MQKAIVIGASSGIGKELAIILAKNGYEVGLMARRIELLRELQLKISTTTYADYMDVSHPEEAIERLQKMIQNMNGVDLIVINSGTGFLNPEMDWLKEKTTIDVNVLGFCALQELLLNIFPWSVTDIS